MSAKVTAKAVSQVQNQVPQFLTEEFPLYEKFIKHYYDFLETLCVYYRSVEGYTAEFTLGETVTGLTSGATGTIKATGAYTENYKLFIEPTNDINFLVDETINGTNSSSRALLYKINRHPLNASKTFSDIINSDETTEGVLKSFKKELYPNIRDDATGDLRLFLKNIKKFYRAKGNEKSFRTLFRLLYGQENLDFYYPKTDLLKVSDGNWNQDIVLQLDYDASYLDFNGLTITGSISSATAFVNNVTSRKLGTIPIIELVLTSINGTFQVGEEITATTGAGVSLIAILSGMLTGVTITNGGNGYDVGDSITITDSSYVGFGAVASVSTTTADQVSNITISNSGNGYQINDVIVFDNADTNADVTAEATIATLKDTFQQDVITSQVYEAITTKSFSLNKSFAVTVLGGYLVANHSTYTSGTKRGEVVYLRTSFGINTAFTSDPVNTNIITNNSAFASATKKFTVSYYDTTNEVVIGTMTLGTDFANGDRVYLFTSAGVSIDVASTVTLNSTPLSELRVYDQASDPDDILLEDGDSILLENASGNLLNEELSAIEFVNGDALYLFNSSGVAIAGAAQPTITDTTIINPVSDLSFNSSNFYASNYNFNKTSGTYARSGSTITATVSTGHTLAEQFTINNAFSTNPVATDIITNHATFGSASKKFTVSRYDSFSKKVYGYSTLGTFVNTDTIYLFNSDGTTARDVDGGTAINSTLSVGSLTIDITSGQLVGSGDDNVSHTIATVANSTIFTFASGTSGGGSGSFDIIPNANNTIKNSLQVENQTFGSINTVSITSFGSGYESTPSLSVINDYYNNLYEPDSENGGYYGRNGELTVATPLGGQVTEVTISEPGFGYQDTPAMTFSGTSDGNAAVTGSLTVTRTKPGSYVGESGFTSSQKKVQDNDYYQDFSYVLKTTDSVNVWKNDVLKLLHPAGLKLFGEVSVVSLINSQMFDRGLNNINSRNLITGLQQYRDVTFEYVSVNLGLTTISAELALDAQLEMEIDLPVTNYLGWNSYLDLDASFYKTNATCDTTNGNPQIGLDDSTIINVGMTVSGSGIPSGSLVSTIDSPTQITISNNATATATNVTLSFTTEPVAGDIITDHATWANVSKKLLVVRFDNFKDRVYGLEVQGYNAFRNGERVYLFNGAGTAIDTTTVVYTFKNDLVQEGTTARLDNFLMEGNTSGHFGHLLYEGQDNPSHYNREYNLEISPQQTKRTPLEAEVGNILLENASGFGSFILNEDSGAVLDHRVLQTTDFTIIDPDDVQRPVKASVEITFDTEVEVTFDDDGVASSPVVLGTPAANVDLDLVSLFNSSMGTPAEMFGLMSVKTTSGFTAGTSTVFTTSSTHFFQDNAEVYLDGYEGTAAILLNGKRFRVSNVGAGNSTSVTLVDEEFAGLELETASGGGEVLLEDGVPSTSVMPLYDGSNSTEGSMLTEFSASAIDTTGLTITSHGRIYKPGKHMTSGILINLFEDEYIGDYSTQVIDNYEHNSPATMSSLSVGNVIDITPTRLDIESSVILEDSINGDLLLEDGTVNAASAIGKVLADEGTLDIDSTYDDWELMINSPEQKQIAGIENNTLEFNRVFDYREISYENNFGFAYYKHKIEKRVAHVGNP